MNFDFFGLFDYRSGDSDTYEYTATEFNKFFKAIAADGVVKDFKNELSITYNGLVLTIGAGAAFVQGRFAENTSSKQISLDAANGTRVDTLVVKVDVGARTVSLTVKKGSTTLTQNEAVWEMPLAAITITNGAITAIEDKRTYFYTASSIKGMMDSIIDGAAAVYAKYY